MQNPASASNRPSRRALLTGRISSPPDSTAPRIAMIGAGCLAHRNIVCRSCSESCEAGAIRFRLAAGSAGSPQIDTGLCTGCGDCMAVCPASAIALQPAPPPPAAGETAA